MTAYACPRCDRRFAREAHLALHGGRDHAASLVPDERARFDAAVVEEEAWLAAFRRHVRAGLAVLPVAVVFLGIMLLVVISGINPFFGLLLLPGTTGFGALVYYLVYSKSVEARVPGGGSGGGRA